MVQIVDRALAIDTETTGLYLRLGCRVFIVTACDTDGNIYKWEFRVDPLTREPVYDKKTLRHIQSVLDSYDVWVFHNSLFDLLALELLGIKIDWNKKTIHDTMFMAHAYNSMGRLGLKPLAFLYLSFPEDDEADLQKAVVKCRRIGKNHGWSIASSEVRSLRPIKKDEAKSDYWLPREVALRLDYDKDHPFHTVAMTYAVKDVERTIGLYMFFKYNSNELTWKAYLRNAQTIYPTHLIQGMGVHVLEDKIRPKQLELKQIQQDQLRTMRAIARNPKFNPKSTIDLPKILYGMLKLQAVAYSEVGNPKNDKESILEMYTTAKTPLQKRFLKALIYFRKLSTAINYIDSYVRFLEDGYLYQSLNPVGTKTVRYSCSNPNTQNISKQENSADAMLIDLPTVNLRGLFGPKKGRLWIAIDYVQLQLCIFAYACNDKVLIEAFKNKADIHNAVAKRIFNVETPTSDQRRMAKTINFGIIFGAGKSKIDGTTKRKGLFDEFSATFPLVRSYIAQQSKLIKKQGYCLTLGDYPLRVQKNKAYKACNFIVQGAEGVLVKIAIVNVVKYCLEHKLPFFPIMTVHDEIILETTKNISKKVLFTKYKQHILAIFDIMRKASIEIGVVTDVDASLISVSWDKKESVSL